MKKKADKQEALKWYISEKEKYNKLAKKVESIILEILEQHSLSYHMVTCRTKELESFRKKIDNDKYDDPINQVTDLAGIRIITYVEDELYAVQKVIEDTFDIDLHNSLDKSSELGIDKVGYKSIHYVAKLKADRLKLPEYKIFKDKYFEVQIRTILQHAWAEIEHDRNYKFFGKLPDEIARRFKLLAGALEILDREFNNISKEIGDISKEVEEGTKTGKLDFELNSTSLKQYIETKFQKLWDDGFEPDLNITSKLLDELKLFGIENLKDLDNIVPQDYANQIALLEDKKTKITAHGLIRSIMIINDWKKYFSQSWGNSWKVWSAQSNLYNRTFEHYGIKWNQILEEFGVKFNE